MYNIKTDDQKRVFIAACKMFIIDFKQRYNKEFYSLVVMECYKLSLDFIDEGLQLGLISDYDYNEFCYVFDYIVQRFLERERNYHYCSCVNIG